MPAVDPSSPCVVRGRGSEQTQGHGECGGLSGRCGAQELAVRICDVALRGRGLAVGGEGLVTAPPK